METIIEKNVTQQDARQVAKTLFTEQTTVWGGVIFIIFAVIIAVWWVNQAES